MLPESWKEAYREMIKKDKFFYDHHSKAYILKEGINMSSTRSKGAPREER